MDQRGEPRPFDAPTIANSIAQLADAGDMGAVELQASEVPAATPTGPSIVQVPIPSKCGGRQADVGPNPGHSHGDARNNVIVGSPGPDVIRGRKGDDLICGLGGNDRLIGGTGKDRLIGGAGNDVLIGGQGEDQLKGGSGKDKLRQ